MKSRFVFGNLTKLKTKQAPCIYLFWVPIREALWLVYVGGDVALPLWFVYERMILFNCRSMLNFCGYNVAILMFCGNDDWPEFS
jgi:hypothetical protein